ncbi:MAG: VWA domain-containing protein, partial [Planctomycetes bacterium]|nr:VWA domain-containing protein [Planctomycetota bacterium]
MSKRSVCVLPLFLVMGGLLVAAARASDQPKDSFGARLVTYDQAAGESYFALSVTPKAQPPRGAKVQDVVVLVDTSASQKNLFRDDSLTAVNELIRRLDPQDRVRLFAVDIEATPLHDDFSSAGSQDVKDALAKLAQRTPLGATDMVAGLKAAVDSFGEPSGNPRVVIYVGDGVSFAKLVDRSDLRQLVDRLVTCQAAVSSYAIGPRRDISFLAVLANQSGGMVYIDSDDSASPQAAGAELAKVVEQTVYWPRDVQLPNCLVEVYPSTIPPLRADRETIVIGKLDRPEAARLVVTAEANGQVTELIWDFAAERSSEDFAFLPALVDLARDDAGLTLPTVGWAGLQEAARVLLSGAADLSVIEINKPVADAADSHAMPENVVHFVAFQQEAAGDAAASNTDGDLQLELEAPTRIVEEAEAGRRVMTGKIQAEVEVGLSDARKQMGTNSEAAVQGLKAILDNVLRAPDLDPQIRAQLRDRIQTAIREASRRKAEQDEIRRQSQENMAIAQEARRLAVELTDRRKQVQQLMEKYDALVDEGIAMALEGRNEEAEENFSDAMLYVADPIEALLPYHPIGESARFNADFLRQLTGQRKFRQLRHKNFANTLYEVERAAIPFPDEPPIVYPDAEKWERLSEEREKYKSMDLLGSGTKEKRIYDALLEETILEFDEAPLSEVVDYLKTARNIPIVIDKRALDDVGLGTDTPVTISLAGITLRSALKIMLKELDLTYVIRDEVLKITTPEEAENELITKVYPVGDL